MIAELRRKLVKICALSSLAVLVLIFALIYALSLRQLNEAMDMLTERIAANGGRFPEFSAGEQARPPAGPAGDFVAGETGASTRFFVVSFDEEGEAVHINVGAVSSVSADDAAAYAGEAAAGGKQKGWYENYRYLRYEKEESYDLVFVDGTMNKAVFHMALLSAGIVLSVSWVVIAALTLSLSRRAVRPLAESYEKQKRFVSDANHELKTPLALMMANIDIVEAEMGKNEWLSDARSEGQRMSRLINQLGVLTRMDEGPAAGGGELVDLSGLLSDKIIEFAAVAKRQGKEISAAIEEGVSCRGEEEPLARLAAILLDNAVKYGDPGGMITASLRGGRRPRFEVANPCRTIDEIEMDRLFDRFYRADKSRSSEGGFGIGLSIAAAIVREQGGEIRAYEKDEKTIAFRVTFA